jgi:hypothetical protein
MRTREVIRRRDERYGILINSVEPYRRQFKGNSDPFWAKAWLLVVKAQREPGVITHPRTSQFIEAQDEFLAHYLASKEASESESKEELDGAM